MKAIVQRVLNSTLSIDGKEYSSINKGFMVLIGITHNDTIKDVKVMAEKIMKLRVFEDENGKMNLSIKDIEKLPTIYSFDVEPFTVGTQKIESILLRNYDYDKSLCPNESVISIMIDQYQDDYDYWDNLFQSDKDEYNKEKEQMAKEVIDRIITKFPSLEGKITLLDTFTPLTITRYVNTYKGAYMSFLFTKKNNMYWGNQKVKGLNNVFLASQWMTSPGGLPFAMTNGVWSIQRICQKEKIKYLLGDEPSKRMDKK